MTYEKPFQSFIKRSWVELSFAFLITAFFFCSSMIGLKMVLETSQWSKAWPLFVVSILLSLTYCRILIKRFNLAKSYISKIEVLEDQIQIEYYHYNIPQSKLTAPIDQFEIHINTFAPFRHKIRFTSDSFTITQIDHANWSVKDFAAILKELRIKQNQALTYDEANFVKKYCCTIFC